jgi:hypothetical protein
MRSGLQQVLGAGETGFARQFIADIRPGNRGDRIHDHVPLVHAVSSANFDVKSLPDPDRAPDPSASNSFAKPLGEDHDESDISRRPFGRTCRGRII